MSVHRTQRLPPSLGIEIFALSAAVLRSPVVVGVVLVFHGVKMLSAISKVLQGACLQAGNTNSGGDPVKSRRRLCFVDWIRPETRKVYYSARLSNQLIVRREQAFAVVSYMFSQEVPFRVQRVSC